MKTELINKLQIGSKIRFDNKELLHIRAIVDKDVYICRFWSRDKRCWYYVVKYLFTFELYHDYKRLKFVK